MDLLIFTLPQNLSVYQVGEATALSQPFYLFIKRFYVLVKAKPPPGRIIGCPHSGWHRLPGPVVPAWLTAPMPWRRWCAGS